MNVGKSDNNLLLFNSLLVISVSLSLLLSSTVFPHFDAEECSSRVAEKLERLTFDIFVCYLCFRYSIFIQSRQHLRVCTRGTTFFLFFMSLDMSTEDEVSAQLLLLSSTLGRIIWGGFRRVVSTCVDESIILYRLPHALSSWFHPHHF